MAPEPDPINSEAARIIRQTYDAAAIRALIHRKREEGDHDYADWLERVMPDAVGPADDVALLLSPLREAGHIVKDRQVGEVIEYTTSIDGHAYTGRGPDDHTAVCALLLACGWDLE